MEEGILRKLRQEIDQGITTEKQVVYILHLIRKMLEKTKGQWEKKEFSFLEFHCNWVLHTSMDRPFAQKFLELVEPGHKEMKRGVRIEELSLSPRQKEDFKNIRLEPRSEIAILLDFLRFRKQLIEFLIKYNLPVFVYYDLDWVEFLYLYGCVIQDCPITVPAKYGCSFEVVHLNVKSYHLYDDASKEDRYWRVFELTDKDGTNGVVYRYDSVKD